MKEFIVHFKKLDVVHKNLVYLMQTYFLGTVVGGVFVNIYVFKYFGDIEGVILYNTLLYVMSFVGFFVVGLFLSNFKGNMKYAYLIAYVCFIIGFLGLLFFPLHFFSVFFFAFLFGFGNGSFWCANHSYELSQVEKEKRDFYSSSVTFGKTFISVVFPFFVSMIFLFTDNTHFISGYQVLFLLLPLLYMSSFWFIKYLPEYIPNNVSIKNVFSHFHPKEIYQNLFFIFSAQTSTLPKITLILVSIYLLKTEVNIGIFQAILGIISLGITALLSTKRNEKNRMKILGIFAFLIFLNYIFLGLFPVLIIFIGFTLLDLIFKPGFEISAIVYTMKYMGDIKKDHKMFLSKVIFREFVLLIGRLLFLMPFLALILYGNYGIEDLIKMSLFYTGLSYFLSFIFAYIEERRIENTF